MKSYKDVIDVHLCCFRSLAEKNKSEMSVNVYNEIWNLIQSIENDLKEVEDYEKHIDGLASDLEEEPDDFEGGGK